METTDNIVVNRSLTAQAEMAVIGAIIIDSALLSKIIDKVNLEDFSHSELKETYKAILELSNDGKGIDYISVLNKLLKANFCSENEIKSLLLNCAETTPKLGNIEYYAEIVHKSAVVRKVKKVISEAVFDGISCENVVEECENLISNLSEILMPVQNRKIQSLREISGILIDYYGGKTDKIENRCDTGYPKIDNLLKGMSGGNLIILASRPKVGKTAFALWFP